MKSISHTSVSPHFQIITCQDKADGTEKVAQWLQSHVDRSTVLFLSGGSSPEGLYTQIASEGVLLPGAVALVDERFGTPLHAQSNELMIQKTGLPDYLSSQQILYDTVLSGTDFQETVTVYEKKIQHLFAAHQKSVAVMGIGEDGHTAGILPHTKYDHSQWVIGYESHDQYLKRITLSFEGLNQISSFVLLIFGEAKRQAFQAMFKKHTLEAVPAAFYTKTILPVTVFTDLHLE